MNNIIDKFTKSEKLIKELFGEVIEKMEKEVGSKETIASISAIGIPRLIKLILNNMSISLDDYIAIIKIRIEELNKTNEANENSLSPETKEVKEMMNNSRISYEELKEITLYFNKIYPQILRQNIPPNIKLKTGEAAFTNAEIKEMMLIINNPSIPKENIKQELRKLIDDKLAIFAENIKSQNLT